MAMDTVLDQLRGRLPADATVVAATAGPVNVGLAEGASRQMVPAGDGVPFSESCEVVVPRAYERTFDVCGHSTPFAAAVPKGHRMLMSIWLRAPKMTGGRTGTVILCLEKCVDPWTAVASSSATIGPDWRQVIVQGVAPIDYPEKGMHISIHLATQQQVIELGGAAIIDLGGYSDVARLPGNDVTWAGREANAPWREEAKQRIQRYRMAPLNIRVVDAKGAPVTGATVEVNQVKRAFRIGSCTMSSGRNVLMSDTPDGRRTREMYHTVFDRATIPLYWSDWGWPNRREEWVNTARWAANQGLELHGHPLIYPGWSYMPREMKKLSTDPKALQARMLEQIRDVGSHMEAAGVVFKDIDVTNELRDLTEISNLVGKDGVAEWFAEARKAFPGTKLALNENTILENDGNTLHSRDNLLGWYRYLDAHGQAPDILGFQGHFGEGVTAPEKAWAILDRFSSETRAEFQISEFDLNTANDQLQADYLRDFMIACYAHPRMTAFTFWGFWEGDHWIPQAAMWRKDWSARPAAKVLEQLVHDWTTHATVQTDAHGEARVPAYLGELEVTVRVPGAGAKPLSCKVELDVPNVAKDVEVQQDR